MNRYLRALIAVSLLWSCVCWGGPFQQAVNSKNRDKKLHAVFDQFPLLEDSTGENGKPMFQSFDMTSPLNINGVDFYGFRFKVFGRSGHEDLVWAFLQNGFATWYITSQTGMTDGFRDYQYQPLKTYQDTRGLAPWGSRQMVVQHLSGDLLEDNKEYLIWFAYSAHAPKKMSVKFTFADVPPKKARNMRFLENILGLERKPVVKDSE
jgi:hypothetical protein